MLPKFQDAKLTCDELAEALYEGTGHLNNLAEKLARQHGKAGALSFYFLMDEDVQNFWRGIAKELIKHARCWLENKGSGCVLADAELERLRSLPRVPKDLESDEGARAMTCMTVKEAIEEARLEANTSNMSEACFARLDAARTLADEVERLRAKDAESLHFMDDINKLVAEVERLQADARRYRVLEKDGPVVVTQAVIDAGIRQKPAEAAKEKP